MAGPEILHLDVVTPRGQVLDLQVREIVAQGTLGEFGVLTMHIPFLSALAEGELRLRQGAGWRTLQCGKGVCEVGPEKVVILAETVIRDASVALEALLDWEPERATGAKMRDALGRAEERQREIEKAYNDDDDAAAKDPEYSELEALMERARNAMSEDN